MAQGDIVGLAQVVRTRDGVELNIPVNLIGAVPVFAQSKDLDFGAPGRMKYVDYLLFDCQADADVTTLEISVGVRDKIGTDYPVEFTALGFLDFGNPIVPVRLEARYFTFLLSDPSPIIQWTIARIEVYGEVTGAGRW